jgi:hypothetical protein
MRMELMTSARGDVSTGELGRSIGAAVVRPEGGGGVVLELGPADGPPHFRLILTNAEAVRLSATVRGVASGDTERVLIVDEESGR